MNFLSCIGILIAIIAVLLQILIKFGSGSLFFDMTIGTIVDPPKLCARPENANPWKRPECFFSESYHLARSKFIEEAERAGADKIDRLPLVSTDDTKRTTKEREYYGLDEDLSIDIAIFEGRKDKLFIHVSGTHGTEGFAGSAIQSAVMRSWNNNTEQWLKGRSAKEIGPTVMFVHALNPFGFANYRRFNEHNVDINRNANFQPGEFEKLMKRDPNIAGYEDLHPYMNPKGPPAKGFELLKFGFHLGQKIMEKGFTTLKTAMVTGTYTREKGVVFGGFKLQQSHILFRKYLENSGYLDTVTELVFIDVHTGLGPLGRDSMLLDSIPGLDRATVVLKDTKGVPEAENWPAYSVEVNGKGDGASAGYEYIEGNVPKNYFKLFKKEIKSPIAAAQEFGTYPGFYVGGALFRENQAWHYDRENRDDDANRILEVFNPSRALYQERVVKRGITAFRQCYRTFF